MKKNSGKELLNYIWEQQIVVSYSISYSGEISKVNIADFLNTDHIPMFSLKKKDYMPIYVAHCQISLNLSFHGAYVGSGLLSLMMYVLAGAEYYR